MTDWHVSIDVARTPSSIEDVMDLMGELLGVLRPYAAGGAMGEDRWGFSMTVHAKDAEEAVAVARRAVADAFARLGIDGPGAPVELVVKTMAQLSRELGMDETD